MVELLKRSCKTLECFIVYTLILELDSFRKQYIVFWFFLEYDVGETKLTEKILSHWLESNPQPFDYWSDALPTELQRLVITWRAESLVKFLSIPAGHTSRICSLDMSDSHILLYDSIPQMII